MNGLPERTCAAGTGRRRVVCPSLRTGLLTVLSLVAVAGCGADRPGPISAGSPPSSVSEVPPILAPPIDLTRAKGDPCALLSESDLAGLGVMPGGVLEPDGVNGRACRYTPVESLGPLLTVVINDITGGLDGLYELRSRFTTFDPGYISGYPTVNAVPGPGTTVCSPAAGVNDAELVNIDLDVGYKPPPTLADRCAVAYRLLAAAVTRAPTL